MVQGNGNGQTGGEQSETEKLADEIRSLLPKDQEWADRQDAMVDKIVDDIRNSADQPDQPEP